ncbi:unnamed protein product, partial [Closterium sp. NIES-53]
GYTFSLGSGSVSWRFTRSSSVLGSSCEAEIYAGAMAAQELRWLTYLLTDLGEPPRSPPVLYVDNKAMLALCREHRLEHRMKHIALRYFLARELQQLRLSYVASEANTADIFTKALPPGDHQRFCTMLACFALLDWSCDLLFSPTLPMGFNPSSYYSHSNAASGARAGESRAGDTGAVGAGAGGTGLGGTDSGGSGAEDTGTIDPIAEGAGAGYAVSGGTGAGGTVRPRSYFVPLFQEVLRLPSFTGLTPPLLCPPPDHSQPLLQPASPLPAPFHYTEQIGGLTERREPESRPALSVRAVSTTRRVPRPFPPPVLGTHAMALRPSSIPLCVPLPPPPESSLPAVLDTEFARAASPTVSRLLATVVTDPSFESITASALVAKLSASPPSFGGECALSRDVLEDRQEDIECLAAAVPRFASKLLAPEGDPDAPDIPTPRSYAEAIKIPSSSHWQAAMDAEMAYWKSTGTYVDAVPLLQSVIGIQLLLDLLPHPEDDHSSGVAARRCSTSLRVALSGLQYSFLARQPARGDQAAPPTLLHWVVSCRYPVEPPAASLRSPPFAARVARHTEDYTCGSSTADLSLFLRTDTSLPPFYVLVLQRFDFNFSSPQPTPLSTGHSLSAPPSDESVEPSGPYPELVGCLILSGMGLVLGGRGLVVLTCQVDASWVDDSATQRSSQGYTFSLGSSSVSWRSICQSLVFSSSCEAEIYAGAMAAQELRWLTYLLTGLGEQPCSPPVL